MHRIKEQLRAWGLLILLCHVDVEDMVGGWTQGCVCGAGPADPAVPCGCMQVGVPVALHAG